MPTARFFPKIFQAFTIASGLTTAFAALGAVNSKAALPSGSFLNCQVLRSEGSSVRGGPIKQLPISPTVPVPMQAEMEDEDFEYRVHTFPKQPGDWIRESVMLEVRRKSDQQTLIRETRIPGPRESIELKMLKEISERKDAAGHDWIAETRLYCRTQGNR